ncbi:unnamed protein product [Echinostoma caproni]|uniref:Gag protein n=1 Tax=Echinostoma caproni TaxID=27848 RepID=A0A183BBI5_9TREM|nr:unnamed protein product [Echinostoma caproni]
MLQVHPTTFLFMSENFDKQPGGEKLDEKLQMRTAVNVKRLQTEKVSKLSSPKNSTNMSFAPLVASTPGSIIDISTEKPTIVGILNSKLLSHMKPSHAPEK